MVDLFKDFGRFFIGTLAAGIPDYVKYCRNFDNDEFHMSLFMLNHLMNKGCPTFD